jgi:hypothetical protein
VSERCSRAAGRASTHQPGQDRQGCGVARRQVGLVFYQLGQEEEEEGDGAEGHKPLGEGSPLRVNILALLNLAGGGCAGALGPRGRDCLRRRQGHRAAVPQRCGTPALGQNGGGLCQAALAWPLQGTAAGQQFLSRVNDAHAAAVLPSTLSCQTTARYETHEPQVHAQGIPLQVCLRWLAPNRERRALNVRCG